VLLNDRTYLEAAQALAAVVLSESPADATRLMQLFRRVLLRSPTDAETQQLTTLLHRQLLRFSATPDAATDLMAEAGVVSDGKHPTEELAAWTVVAHTILNLDETVTRR